MTPRHSTASWDGKGTVGKAPGHQGQGGESLGNSVSALAHRLGRTYRTESDLTGGGPESGVHGDRLCSLRSASATPAPASVGSLFRTVLRGATPGRQFGKLHVKHLQDGVHAFPITRASSSTGRTLSPQQRGTVRSPGRPPPGGEDHYVTKRQRPSQRRAV